MRTDWPTVPQAAVQAVVDAFITAGFALDGFRLMSQAEFMNRARKPERLLASGGSYRDADLSPLLSPDVLEYIRRLAPVRGEAGDSRAPATRALMLPLAEALTTLQERALPQFRLWAAPRAPDGATSEFMHGGMARAAEQTWGADSSGKEGYFLSILGLLFSIDAFVHLSS